MKKSIKGICIGAGCAVALGGLLIFAGKLLGGDMVSAIEMDSSFKPKVITTTHIKADCEYREYDIEEFDTLDIIVSSVDIEIVKGTERKLEVNAPEVYFPEISQSGSNLKIKQPNLSNVSLTITSKGITPTEVYYRLTVTDDDIIDANIGATSGEITVDDVNIRGRVSVTSGDINLSDIESKDISVHTTSGEININKCNFTDGITTDSTSGGLNVEGVETSVFGSQTTSGEKFFSNVKAGEFKSSGTSGGTKAVNLEADKIIVNGTSSEVNLKLDGSEDEYNIAIHTTSGDIRVGNHSAERDYSAKGSTDKTVDIDVTSGDVKIEF